MEIQKRKKNLQNNGLWWLDKIVKGRYMNVELSGLLKQAREAETNISLYICMCVCVCVCMCVRVHVCGVRVHMGWMERGDSEDSSWL